MHYEDMHADLTQCFRLVAQFLKVGTDDPELLKLVEKPAKHSLSVDAFCLVSKGQLLGVR